ncbi:hypothetical protein [Janibacter sp. G368]|uniref:hypothetical protein n=1 Tax=Janibacter sp. G368 TaxID=3420441 RepID=UPI003D07501D
MKVGERISQLPKKRTGPQGRWVCAPCRWPDPDRVIDLDFVIRKGEQRIAKGPSYTPSMAEIDLIVTAFGYLEPLDQDELVVLKMLRDAQLTRQSPTMGRAKTAVIVRAMLRAKE